MEIILVHPEIPANAGNIARTCAATGTKLTFVRPLGFSLADRHLKRAGMDYWEHLTYRVVDDYTPTTPFYCFSTKGKRPYTEVAYEKNAKLIFGAESAGLPHHYHEQWPEHFYTIPMLPETRSLNLSNSVAIVLYEALRQQDFTGLRSPSS